MKEDGGPAFGGAYDQVFGEDNGKGALHKIEARARGMSLRDYFSAKAMQAHILADAFIAAQAYAQDKTYSSLEAADIARLANEQADAMLAARNK